MVGSARGGAARSREAGSGVSRALSTRARPASASSIRSSSDTPSLLLPELIGRHGAAFWSGDRPLSFWRGLASPLPRDFVALPPQSALRARKPAHSGTGLHFWKGLAR